LPVLARINAGNDLEALIRDMGIGRVVVGDRPEELQTFAEELLADPGSRERMADLGRTLADEIFAPRAAVMKILMAVRGHFGGWRPVGHRRPTT